MSDRYKGGIIRSAPFTTSRFGQNSGMFTLGQQFNAFAAGNWPTDYDVILQFTESSTWECPAGVTEIEYLIVAGGGGTGNDTAGGAGGGGVRQGSGYPVASGTYTISVGSGGTTPAPSAGAGSNGVGSFIQGGSPTTTHLGSNGGGAGGALDNRGMAGGCGGGHGANRTGTNYTKTPSLTLTAANGHASLTNSTTQNSEGNITLGTAQ